MKKYFSSSRLFKKIVHLSSIFFAVGALSYSDISFADVEGIPYNRDFPNAQYPYAQAPDGCSGWQSTREVRDTWGSVNFTGACDNHDRCYYTRGSNWNTCNERFYSDLRAACERDLRIPIRRPAPTLEDPSRTVVYKYGPPEPIALGQCYRLASGYYAGVQAGVLLDVFKKAQDKQRRYEEWVASVRNSTPNYNQLNARAAGCYYIRSLNNNFRNSNFRWLDGASDGKTIVIGTGQSHGTIWQLEQTNRGNILRSMNRNYLSRGNYRWLDGASDGRSVVLSTDTTHGAFWDLQQVQSAYRLRSLNNNFRNSSYRWLDGASDGKTVVLSNGTSHGTLWELTSTSCP